MPILLYSASVWHPSLRRDREMVEKVVRYGSRVAKRCHTSLDQVAEIEISEEFRCADINLFERIRQEPVRFSKMFSVVITNTRSRANVLPAFCAKKNTVDDTFTFRICRALHERPTL